MKRRFITTLTLVFTLLFILLSFFQFHYFEMERLRLIDQQIDRSIADLVSTDLIEGIVTGKLRIEEIVYENLEDEPLNLLIYIRDEAGNILYQNESAKNLGFLPPQISEGKYMFEDGGRKIRYSSHLLPYDKLLQVGLVLDQGQVLWHSIQAKSVAIMLACILFFLLVSIFMTNFLLRPVNELAQYFEFMAKNPEHIPPVPALADSGEFSRLESSVRRNNENWQTLLKHQTSILARLVHEIRTPLTIARNILEEEKRRSVNSASIVEAMKEMEYVELISKDFMSWTRIEYSIGREIDTHALKVKEVIFQLLAEMKVDDRVILKLDIEENYRLFINPAHFRILFVNLIENGIRHGIAGEKVFVNINDKFLEFRNKGAKIPENVSSNFGQPFNRGADIPGSTGLGLANIVSVCKMYSWTLQYNWEDGWNIFRINPFRDSNS